MAIDAITFAGDRFVSIRKLRKLGGFVSQVNPSLNKQGDMEKIELVITLTETKDLGNLINCAYPYKVYLIAEEIAEHL